MGDTLQAKLKEILQTHRLDNCFPEPFEPDVNEWTKKHKRKQAESTQRAIRQIEQAFIDDGYANLGHYSGEPEKHPIPCDDCRSDEWADYLLPHSVWNAVCPGGAGYLCLPCFAKRMDSTLMSESQWQKKAIEEGWIKPEDTQVGAE